MFSLNTYCGSVDSYHMPIGTVKVDVSAKREVVLHIETIDHVVLHNVHKGFRVVHYSVQILLWQFCKGGISWNKYGIFYSEHLRCVFVCPLRFWKKTFIGPILSSDSFAEVHWLYLYTYGTFTYSWVFYLNCCWQTALMIYVITYISD